MIEQTLAIFIVAGTAFVCLLMVLASINTAFGGYGENDRKKSFMKRKEQSEMSEDYEFLKSLELKKRNDNEPGRWEYTLRVLKEKGYCPEEDRTNKCIRFQYQGNTITVYPYKGWFSGKGVKDGRGIAKLLKQI